MSAEDAAEIPQVGVGVDNIIMITTAGPNNAGAEGIQTAFDEPDESFQSAVDDSEIDVNPPSSEEFSDQGSDEAFTDASRGGAKDERVRLELELEVRVDDDALKEEWKKYNETLHQAMENYKRLKGPAPAQQTSKPFPIRPEAGCCSFAYLVYLCKLVWFVWKVQVLMWGGPIKCCVLWAYGAGTLAVLSAVVLSGFDTCGLSAAYLFNYCNIASFLPIFADANGESKYHNYPFPEPQYIWKQHFACGQSGSLSTNRMVT